VHNATHLLYIKTSGFHIRCGGIRRLVIFPYSLEFHLRLASFQSWVVHTGKIINPSLSLYGPRGPLDTEKKHWKEVKSFGQGLQSTYKSTKGREKLILQTNWTLHGKHRAPPSTQLENFYFPKWLKQGSSGSFSSHKIRQMEHLTRKCIPLVRSPLLSRT